MSDVHWCVTVDYQQIVDSNIANQIHGFTIDYGKFILKFIRVHVVPVFRSLIAFSHSLHHQLLRQVPLFRDRQLIHQTYKRMSVM